MDSVQVYPAILRDRVEHYYKKFRLERANKLITSGYCFKCIFVDFAGHPCGYQIHCTNDIVSLSPNCTRTLPTLITRLMFQIYIPSYASIEHSHVINEIDYISAVYRGNMFTAAEEHLEVSYDRLHTEVLQSMRCVSYFFNCSQHQEFQKDDT
jgi:hypothetical protein